MSDQTVIKLKGRIDSGNSQSVQDEILSQLPKGTVSAVIDASELEYISSAGLRVILRIKKSVPKLKICGVSSEVYEILDMTGFTEMMTVEKAYRTVSVEGCEEIGRGANGTIYRIDKDNVVKVYNNPDALEDIRHEREVARLALILGIPTAISYDVVKVGNGYGSVFELLNAESFSKILAKHPEKMDWCVKEYVEMLKKIHSTHVPKGKLPHIKEKGLVWARFAQDYLPREAGEKLLAMMQAIPESDCMVHGDYHTKNVELQDGEVLLIDMDTLSVGDPVFELSAMFNAYKGFCELDHQIIKDFQGFDYETAAEFWHKVLAAYLGTSSQTKIREVEDKASIISYARLIRHVVRRGLEKTEEGRAELEHRKKRLVELLGKYDSLTFDPDELEIDAAVSNLDEVQSFVMDKIKGASIDARTKMQIDIVVEEEFVNISSYAYAPGKGKTWIRAGLSEDASEIVIRFRDKGVPYDPFAREDPDVTLVAEDRGVGGLGIYMMKQFMDEYSHEFRDGQNIITLRKCLIAKE